MPAPSAPMLGTSSALKPTSTTTPATLEAMSQRILPLTRNASALNPAAASKNWLTATSDRMGAAAAYRSPKSRTVRGTAAVKESAKSGNDNTETHIAVRQ